MAMKKAKRVSRPRKLTKRGSISRPAVRKKKKKTAKRSAKKSTAKKQGLYANIHKAQLREKKGGRKVRHKGETGSPTDMDFEKAAKTKKLAKA